MVAPEENAETGRTKKALIANIRHELRTPINAVIGYSEILLEDAEQSGHDEIIPDIEKIHRSGTRLLGLLDEIFDSAKIEASGVDISSEDFGAHIRHELRTPLNAIIGYSELLLECVEDAGEETLCSDLRKVHTAGKRLLGLIEDIVSLSKIEAGHCSIESVASGESSLVHDVVTTIRSLASEDNPVQVTEGGAILVVDDNEMNRDMLSRHLARQGYEVSMSGNGLQALEMLRQTQFDLLLLDMIMPGMNGYQVLQQIKNDDVLRHIPVIMVSALDDLDAVVRCIESGADDYLPKPFNPVLLKARIGACLEKKRLRDREQEYLKQLRAEREKSERLLLNILPEPIAGRLKLGETPIADSYAEATVIFADLVGFTKLAAAMPAKELVAVLDDIFCAFDRLCLRHGLEKIKTIGDSYMAVAGLPTPSPNHLSAAADMALGCLDATAQIRLEFGIPFSLRVGINTGPVVAGVIGRNRFAYDLWGDTVNIASRMESHGVPDGICVTSAVYGGLKDRYAFEERGTIQVKNKGEMQCYLLKGRLSDG